MTVKLLLAAIRKDVVSNNNLIDIVFEQLQTVSKCIVFTQVLIFIHFIAQSHINSCKSHVVFSYASSDSITKWNIVSSVVTRSSCIIHQKNSCKK